MKTQNELIVENIRALAKKDNTSLTKIEAELGFGNGMIGKWAKAPKSPPHDKLVKIADYLSVPVSALTGEANEKNQPATEGDRLNPDYMKLNAANRAAIDAAIAALLKSQQSDG